jgi:hypothetical protein
MTDTPWRQNKKQTPAKSIEESSAESASKFRRFKGQIEAAIQRSVGVRRDVTDHVTLRVKFSAITSTFLHVIRDVGNDRNQLGAFLFCASLS